MCAFLADLVLFLHFCLVLFVVLSVFIIWAGYFLNWAFVRNLPFRVIHLILMGVVLLQTYLGQVCPLTTWEDHLRVLAGRSPRYDGSCMEYWLHRLMFFDLSGTAFKVIYSLFFLLIIGSWVVVRPRWRRARPSHATSPNL